jgi:hypothetical protein
VLGLLPPHPVSPANPAEIASMKIPEICVKRREDIEITGTSENSENRF